MFILWRAYDQSGHIQFNLSEIQYTPGILTAAFQVVHFYNIFKIDFVGSVSLNILKQSDKDFNE